MMKVSVADKHDLCGILHLCREYFEGSGYGRMTYSPERTKAMIDHVLEHGIVVVAKHLDEIVGFATVEFFFSNFVEKCATIGLFYVAETHRGMKVSRLLGEAVCQVLDNNEVSLAYAMSNSRNNDTNRKLFNNLFAKFGFEDKGSLLTRIK